ncbi:MAG: triose-phosphate isomerase [Flavobacteriales bacterium]
MNRRHLVAGNWKMNTSLEEGLNLLKTIALDYPKLKQNQELIIAPPYIHLSDFQKADLPKSIKIAAQNCASEHSGAYTGEVSPAMLADLNISYVILGHSERRSYFGESHDILKRKVDLSLEQGLTPIFCLGEQKEERQSGSFKTVLLKQLQDSVFHLDAESFSKLILAYEPVWAIGTGLTATAEQAEDTHNFIRQEIAKHYSETLADQCTILYGGSCKPSNADELFAQPNVDGGLIGGAALKSADFLAIAEALIRQKQ